jgi:hypothetical protein
MSVEPAQQAPVIDLPDNTLSSLRNKATEIENSFWKKGYLNPQEREQAREITRQARAL